MTRLDIELVSRQIAKSRVKAKEYIKDGRITVNGRIVTKPSSEVTIDDNIQYIGNAEKYVGRGGYKLEKALESFNIVLSDLICIDIGASTGGFTDCMLQNGAAKVYAVDVGHSQLDKKLIADIRVTNIEGVNVKDLTYDLIGERPDFVAADLSFISVVFAAQAAYNLLKDNGAAVFLIKPQFEAGRQNISKGGIVKDKKVHFNVLNSCLLRFSELGFAIGGLICSPIRGGDGNIEYLVKLIKSKTYKSIIPDCRRIIDQGFNI